MRSNTDLVKYAMTMLGHPYIYGTFGQTLTDRLLIEKSEQYPTQINTNRLQIASNSYVGQKVTDCSGLIKGFIMGADKGEPVYNSKYDKNARQMYNACSRKGLIADIPEVKGLLVFNKSLTHVGVYIGNGEVIEAKGFDYGVIKSGLKGFYYYGYYPDIDYIGNEITSNCPNISTVYEGKVIAMAGINIRTKPDVNSPKAGAYNYGDIITIVDEKKTDHPIYKNWGLTSRGWVCMDYVKKVIK